MANMQRISPCLWFDGKAQEAAQFYTSVFDNSKILRVARYLDVGQEIHKQPPGSVMTVEFELDGTPFTALNGGPQFRFSEAISLQVLCDSQAEIDYYWQKLEQGGDPKAQQCGWLKDRFGVSWQIVPSELDALVSDPDSKKAGRVMAALLEMKKLDIAALKRAHAGRE